MLGIKLIHVSKKCPWTQNVKKRGIFQNGYWDIDCFSNECAMTGSCLFCIIMYEFSIIFFAESRLLFEVICK